MRLGVFFNEDKEAWEFNKSITLSAEFRQYMHSSRKNKDEKIELRQ